MEDGHSQGGRDTDLVWTGNVNTASLRWSRHTDWKLAVCLCIDVKDYIMVQGSDTYSLYFGSNQDATVKNAESALKLQLPVGQTRPKYANSARFLTLCRERRVQLQQTNPQSYGLCGPEGFESVMIVLIILIAHLIIKVAREHRGGMVCTSCSDIELFRNSRSTSRRLWVRSVLRLARVLDLCTKFWVRRAVGTRASLCCNITDYNASFLKS